MEKVSVIMPCYNDGRYIEEAVESVFTQTYPDIELIVIDDGSDEQETLDVLERLRDKIILLKTDHVRPAGARNYGIERASGKYILPLDSDDRIDKTYIEKRQICVEREVVNGNCHNILLKRCF